jgi:E3 ubiquitin-protein ligase HUWE1
MFAPEYGLFVPSANNQSLVLAPTCVLIPDYKKKLQFLGTFVAKTITDEMTIDINFPNAFLKQFLGKEISTRDLQDWDPDLAKNLQWVLENNIDEMDFNFTYEMEIFGKRITRQLIPEGYAIAVSEVNKKEYVKKLCWEKMVGEVAGPFEEFVKGFRKIIPLDLMKLFSTSELSTLIAGLPEIDIKEMEQHCLYEGYTAKDDVVNMFFDILHEFTHDEKGAFLYYISGSTRVPYGGFKSNRIKIIRTLGDTNKLPIAHTCFFSIELPNYENPQKLREKLLLAMYEGTGSGFLMG